MLQIFLILLLQYNVINVSLSLWQWTQRGKRWRTCLLDQRKSWMQWPCTTRRWWTWSQNHTRGESNTFSLILLSTVTEINNNTETLVLNLFSFLCRFEKLQFLLQQNPFPPETLGNLLLLYCRYQCYDLAADVLADNAHLTHKYLSPVSALFRELSMR